MDMVARCLLYTDAAQNGQKPEGPCKIIAGASYVDKLDGIVTYGDGDEIFLFTNAAPDGQKLEGPCENILGATHVGKLIGLETYGFDGEEFLFADATQSGQKLEGMQVYLRCNVW